MVFTGLLSRITTLLGRTELMAPTLTGYVYPSATSITPYLEPPRTGPTSLFCADLATRLKCHVVAGYPELLGPEEIQDEKVGANSAVVYGPTGEWVGGYR